MHLPESGVSTCSRLGYVALAYEILGEPRKAGGFRWLQNACSTMNTHLRYVNLQKRTIPA